MDGCKWRGLMGTLERVAGDSPGVAIGGRRRPER